MPGTLGNMSQPVSPVHLIFLTWFIVNPNAQFTVESCIRCSLDNILTFQFTTRPFNGSLVHFTSGSILGGSMGIFRQPEGGPGTVFNVLGGSITPAPEPSSLVLFVSGLLVLGLTRRFGKKAGQPLRA
jgi:hypothetical protein